MATSVSKCSIENFPFTFFDSQQNPVNGTLTSDGLCIFPTANCDPSLKASDCCTVNNDSDVGRIGSNYMFVCWSFIFLPLFWALWKIYDISTPEEREQQKEEDKAKRPKFITENRHLPQSAKDFLLGLYEFGLSFQITASIMIPIFLKRSQQSNMSATERTGLAASEAFMVPFFTVFTFVEDIIMVRVSYAMSNKDRVLTDRLVHAGLAGVIVTGVAGGIVGTLLGVFTPALKALTIPGIENDKKLYPGCAFIETVDVNTILPYWLMESWELMGKQVNNVLAGFLMGALEFNLLGWISLVGHFFLAGIWFGNIKTYPNPITLLGIAEFVMDWSSPIALFLFLISPLGAQIRERTGLELSTKKVLSYFRMPLSKFRKKIVKESVDNDNEDKDTAAADDASQDTVVLLKDGLKLMFMDIVIQACMTCSVYLALNADRAVAYQITSMQSEMPTYGSAYVTGMAITAKILGPIFLSNGMERIFAQYIRLVMFCGALLMIVVCSTTVPFLDGLAYSSGTNACAYASDEQCLPYFNKVFGPNSNGEIYSLPFTYYVFPIAACIEIAVLLLRTFLLTLLDFDFMLYATIAAGISYIPSIAVVYVVPFGFQKEAIAFFAAYYVPQLVLVVCFGIRLVVVVEKLKKDEEGPWTQKKKIRRMSSMRISSMGAATKAEAKAADQ